MTRQSPRPKAIPICFLAAQIVSEALTAGLLVCSAGEHTVRLLPPLVATRDDLEAGLRILDEIL